MSYMQNTKITNKQKALLSLVETGGPISIYRLAKAASRPYRRVHDHVYQLAAMGKVCLEPGRGNKRRVALVYPNNIYYQRLKQLDDLYSTYISLNPGSAP